MLLESLSSYRPDLFTAAFLILIVFLSFSDEDFLTALKKSPPLSSIGFFLSVSVSEYMSRFTESE